MDANFWRTLSYIAVSLGTALVLIGTIGTWYFGKRLEAVAPYRQPIRTATSTVEVIILSNENVNSTFMDSGGYIAFGKREKPLIIMSSNQCIGKQTGKGKVIYRGVFNMDATDSAVGKPLYFLKEAEFAQVCFFPMPKESKVIEGKAICTFNSIVQIEITIPLQETKEGLIFAHNLESAFSEFRR
jgi:hypothetical protein